MEKNLKVTRSNAGDVAIDTIKPNGVVAWVSAWPGNDASGYDS